MAPSRLVDGRFEILELAGRGGAAHVHQARDHQSGALVALKRLDEQLLEEGSRERFEREARLFMRVQSPHVVRYVAHGVAEERPYLAVEWLDGEDLGRRMRRRRLDGPAVIEVARQTAIGLGALHARGIVHRDVKPGNLFITPRPGGALHLTVIDLGVSHAQGETVLTQAGALIGTPAYMAPEHITGTSPPCASTDFFSLGTVLFELVTGQRPFRGEDAIAVVAKIALTDAPRISERAPAVPASLDSLVARLLERDVGRRFASADELLAALARVEPFVSADLPSESDEDPTLHLHTQRERESLPRIVTALFAQFESRDDARVAAPDFYGLAERHGGGAHTLLDRVHVAVFGAESAQGDEAPRAARAALKVAAKFSLATLSMATGRSSAGQRGVNGAALERGLAQRRAARPLSAILVDEATQRLLGDAFEIEASDGARFLLRERASGGGARLLLGRPAPCVGRERELLQLEALYDEVATESVARAAILIGPAGAGKSRIRHELSERLTKRAPAPLLLFGRSHALAEGAAFRLLRTALFAAAGVNESDPRERAAERVLGLAAGKSVALAEAAFALSSLDAPSGDADIWRERVRDCFGRIFRAITERRGVVLVLEDIEWADQASIAMIELLLTDLAERPLLVLALARPEARARFPRLWEARSPQIFAIDRLSRRAAATIARGALPEASEATLSAIIERADGNPFYLEELVRAVAERGHMEDLNLPDTVLGVVQARIDALGEEARRALAAGSLFGDAFWLDAVREVLTDTRLTDLERSFADLVAREVIERRPASRFSGEVEYAFRHALLRDALSELTPAAEKRAGHCRAGAWLESRGERDAFVLATHFDRGGASNRAVELYVESAGRALYASDFQLAHRCAERARALGVRDQASGRLGLVVAEAHRWQGDLEGALAAARQAAGELLHGGPEWFSAMREQIAAIGRLGRIAELEPLVRELAAALEDGAAPDQDSAAVAALVPAAVHLLYAGRSAAAGEVAAQVELQTARSVLEPRARARVHQLRAALALHHGDPETSAHEQELALGAFDQAGDPRGATLVRSNLGFVLLQLGDTVHAEAILREALGKAAHLGLATVVPLVEQNLGIALERRELWADALTAQTRAANAFRALGDRRLEAASRVYLARLQLARNDPEAARAEARWVLETGFRPLEIGAHAALAQAALAEREPEAALEHAGRAMAILEEVGAVEEHEFAARLAWVDALEAGGDAEAAGRSADAARTLLEERQSRLRDPLRRQSFLEAIPDHARLVERARALTRRRA